MDFFYSISKKIDFFVMFLIWICKTVLEKKKKMIENVILIKWEGRYLGGQ